MNLHTLAKSGCADDSAVATEIDQLDYSLYGLTREEIAIIEENVEKRVPIREAVDDSTPEQET